ncbi:MAG: 2-oxoacid:acceptor oxidoreductase family protein [Candidatus Thorarchaeota archaeon]
MKIQIRIAGTGGMGVVLAGVIVGHAAAVHGNLNVVQSQSYGSEARGTAAKSEVIISDEAIHYPKVQSSDLLIVMSQKALEMYIEGAKKGSVVLIDPDLVDSSSIEGEYEIIPIPAMKTADELGQRIVSNMVMLGALIKKSGIYSIEILEKAVADMVSSKYLKINIKAIRAGAELI